MAKKEKVESIEIIESPEALQQEVSKVTELVDKNKSGIATLHKTLRAKRNYSRRFMRLNRIL
jgi:hypothetical protein